MSEGVGVFFILKKSKFSESDLILQALSEEGEKVGFFVKGALRSKKRFGGGVEPTHLIEVVYQKARQEGGLNLLKEARLIEAFEGLRKTMIVWSLLYLPLIVFRESASREIRILEWCFSFLGISFGF